MTETSTVKISHTCEFVANKYSWGTDVSLDYVEHSTDHWNSDRETSHDIDVAMASKIIAFFEDAFGKEAIEKAKGADHG